MAVVFCPSDGHRRQVTKVRLRQGSTELVLSCPTAAQNLAVPNDNSQMQDSNSVWEKKSPQVGDCPRRPSSCLIHQLATGLGLLRKNKAEQSVMTNFHIVVSPTTRTGP